MDKIVIKNLDIFARHEVFPEENVLGQRVVISTVLHTNTRMAGQTSNGCTKKQLIMERFVTSLKALWRNVLLNYWKQLQSSW